MESEQKQERVCAQDVEQAFDAIFRRGKLKPSQKDVLAELKRGSETTIGQYLSQLYRVRLDPDREDPLSIPASIQTEFLQLWGKACEHASTRWQEQEATLTTELIAVKSDAEEHKKQHEQAILMHQAETAQHAHDCAQQDKLEAALRQQLAETKTQLAASQQRIIEQGNAQQTERAQAAQVNTELNASILTLNTEHQQYCESEQQRMQEIEDSLQVKLDEARLGKKHQADELKQANLAYQDLQKTWLMAKDDWSKQQQQWQNTHIEHVRQLETQQNEQKHLHAGKQTAEAEVKQLTEQLAQLTFAHRQIQDNMVRETTLHCAAQARIEQLTLQLKTTQAEWVREQIKMEACIDTIKS